MGTSERTLRNILEAVALHNHREDQFTTWVRGARHGNLKTSEVVLKAANSAELYKSKSVTLFVNDGTESGKTIVIPLKEKWEAILEKLTPFRENKNPDLSAALNNYDESIR